MNKKLELDFSEIFIACVNNNPDRLKRILHRLSDSEKEKFCRSLVNCLAVTLFHVPPAFYETLKEEFGFEIKIPEVANV